jgi:hypothetical protein
LAWHLAPDLQLVEEGMFRLKDAALSLALLPAQGHGWAEEVRRESWSPVYGQKAPMTVLNFSAEAALPAEFAVVLVTLEEAHRGAVSFVRMEDRAEGAEIHAYRYAAEDVEYSFVFGRRGRPWRKDSLASDAEFVCRKRKPGSVDEHLVLCNGSYAQVDGGPELRCVRPVQWAELVLKDGSRAVFSSDQAAANEPPAAEKPSGSALSSSE